MPRFEVPVLILSHDLPPRIVAKLRERFIAWGPFQPAELEEVLATRGAAVRGVATSGRTRLTRALFDRLPAMEILATFSAGLDNIEVAALEERGIPIASSSPALAEEVADVAIALMVMVTRRLAEADRFMRAGRWPGSAFPLGRSCTGRRIGLLGLGHIGSAIARRAEVMGMRPRYCTRRQRPEVSYPWHPTPLDLARDSDVLMIACPGGPATRRIVNAEVIAAMGPEGFIVNVGRGEVVEEPALIAALAGGRLAGAGLDVFESEPEIAPALRELENVVLTPHLASGSVETREAMGESIVTALTRHFAARG